MANPPQTLAQEVAQGAGIFVAPGFSNSDFPTGVAGFTVYSVEHGIDISSDISQSVNLRSIYMRKRKMDGFNILIKLKSFSEYKIASKFFQNYNDFLTNPNQGGTLQPMVVIVPSRDFMMLGVPTGNYPMGKGIGDYTFTMSLEFTGTINPTSPTEYTSYYQVDADPQSQYYYPLGNQPGSATNNIETLIYDNPSTNKSSNAPTTPMTPIQNFVNQNLTFLNPPTKKR